MRLLRACLLISLFAAIQAFAPDYHEVQVRDVIDVSKPGIVSGDSGVLSGENSNYRRVARSTSPELTSEIESIFTIDNILKVLQRIIKFSASTMQRLTDFLPPNTVKEGIEYLQFPGSQFVGALVEQSLQDFIEMLQLAVESEFVLEEPTPVNFLHMAFDMLVLGHEKVLRLITQLKEVSVVAFDAEDATFNGLRNADFNRPFFVKFLTDAHSFISRLIEGFLKLSSPTVISAVGNIIQESKFPMWKQLSDVIKEVIENVNTITKDLSNSNFIKKKADWKNVHEFIAIAAKSVVIHGLKIIEEILKLGLLGLYKVKGIDKPVEPANYKTFPIEKGLALELINYILQAISKINFDKMITAIHESLRVAAKVTAEITGSESMKQLPEQIRYLGKHLTEGTAKLASLAIEELHSSAVFTKESKFMTEPPLWENAREYICSIIKHVLKVTKRIAEHVKQYFDSHVKDKIAATDWVVDIVKALVPEHYVEISQKVAKLALDGTVSVTGDSLQNTVEQFVQRSGLPLSDKVAKLLSKVMAFIHIEASKLLQNKFITETPTIENAVKMILDALKEGISLGLQEIAEIADYFSSIF